MWFDVMEWYDGLGELEVSFFELCAGQFQLIHVGRFNIHQKAQVKSATSCFKIHVYH